MYIKKSFDIANYNIKGILKPDNLSVYITEDNILTNKFPAVRQDTGSDEQIVSFINDYYNKNINLDDVKSFQSIGDERNITIEAISASGTINDVTQTVGESHHKQTLPFIIIDFNHDSLIESINGFTKALITVQQKDCLRHEGCSNNDGANNTENGYIHDSVYNVTQSTCSRRNQCNAGYFAALPNYIQNLIKQVSKKYTEYNQPSGTYIYYYYSREASDYCQLLSAREINGTTAFVMKQSGSNSQEGDQYPYYTIQSNYNKLPYQDENTLTGYWQTRTTSNNASFCRVSSSSSTSTYKANNLFGLAPAFCL